MKRVWRKWYKVQTEWFMWAKKGLNLRGRDNKEKAEKDGYKKTKIIWDNMRIKRGGRLSSFKWVDIMTHSKYFYWV